MKSFVRDIKQKSRVDDKNELPNINDISELLSLSKGMDRETVQIIDKTSMLYKTKTLAVCQ